MNARQFLVWFTAGSLAVLCSIVILISGARASSLSANFFDYRPGSMGWDLSASGLQVFDVSDDDEIIARDDWDSTFEGVPKDTEVTANDTFENGAINLSVVNGPSNGSAVPKNKFIITYTPNANYNGTDIYRYRICSDQGDDGDGADDDGGGCSEANVTIQVNVSPSDTEQPSVTWTSPVSDQDVKTVNNQIVVLEVQASDNQAVDRVLFYRWDAIHETYMDLATVTAAPYRLELDTSTLNLGWNQISARAYDNVGNPSEVGYIWLYKVVEFFLPVASR